MSKPVNLIRNTPAVLKAKTVNFYGKGWAIQDRADGYSIIDVVAQPAPTEIKSYLEGDSSVVTYPIASNVTKLCKHALASFVNIENIYLFSTTKVVIESEGIDALSGDNIYLGDLTRLVHIYVPSALISEYQASYPYLASKFVSIYEGDVFTFVHFEGQDVLTIAEVERQHAMLSDTQVVVKVVIPVTYTSYESGAIAKIQELFTNMVKLAPTYEAGEMEIDFTDEDWQDIIEKIEEKQKTLDEALVYARYVSINHQDKTSISQNNDVIIIPPMPENKSFLVTDSWNTTAFTFCPNLVYVDKVYLYNNGYVSSIYPAYITKELIIKQDTIHINGFLVYPTGQNNQISTKKVNATFDYQNFAPYGRDYIDITMYQNNNVLITLKDFVDNIKISQSSGNGRPTRECLVGLINSLGIPTTKKTITHNQRWGFSNLTNADIQLAYDKNWQLSPAPAPFTFTIGSNTYSCDFGMTWEQWCASAYNTDNYSQFAGYVVDSNRNYLKLNGENVAPNTMIRYGDVFEIKPYYGSFEYNGTLPVVPNLVSAKYYDDESCTNEVLVADLVIGTTYYYTLVFEYGTNFATDTLEQIKFAYDNNVAQYQLGDTKTITYNNEIHTIRICDIGARYDLSDGSGKNKVTFEFVELVTNSRMQVGGNNTNSGGWASTYVNLTILPNVYNDLPSDLKAVISQVKVASANGGSDATGLIYTDNYLFIPSGYEIYGSSVDSNPIEATTQFGLYAATSGYTLKQKSKIGGNAENWWLRSPYASATTDFICILPSGGNSHTLSAYAYGISVFFCI